MINKLNNNSRNWMRVSPVTWTMRMRAESGSLPRIFINTFWVERLYPSRGIRRIVGLNLFK